MSERANRCAERGRVTLADVLARWRADADALERNGCAREARLLSRCAEEVDGVLADVDAEPVTLDVASRASGYSVAHLRRLVADGALRNVSTNGRVRVRRGDLPRKPALAR